MATARNGIAAARLVEKDDEIVGREEFEAALSLGRLMVENGIRKARIFRASFTATLTADLDPNAEQGGVEGYRVTALFAKRKGTGEMVFVIDSRIRDSRQGAKVENDKAAFSPIYN